MEAVRGIEAYLSAVCKEPLNLKAKPLEVAVQQNGVDCGIHVLNNISTLAKLSKDDLVPEISLKDPVDAVLLRKQILTAAYQTSKKYETALASASTSNQDVLRRSSRKVDAGKKDDNIKRLLTKDETGLIVKESKGNGSGVFATQVFTKGQLVWEYSGEVITGKVAAARAKEYSVDPSGGNFLLFYKYKEKQMCIDATKDNGRMGRMVNHSRKGNNLSLKLVEEDGHVFVCLYANCTIDNGKEILYDYGERNKETVAANPWLAV